MDDKFRVASTMSDIKDKIRINIEEGGDTIYWYIKFNVPLDKTSVTNTTCEVIDTEGYVMRTYIAYDPERNYVVVSPIDSYQNNTYYILTIGEDVRSEKGNHLKKKIHILFKLVNNKISKYEVLKASLKLPESKKRPNDYDEFSKSLSEDARGAVLAGVKEEKDMFDGGHHPHKHPQGLGQMTVNINPTMAILGALFINVGFFADIPIVFFVAVVVFLLGFGHVIYQLNRNRSSIYYNMGSNQFRKKNYEKAEGYLLKAFKIDEMNEQAEYALNRVRRYIARAEHEDSEE